MSHEDEAIGRLASENPLACGRQHGELPHDQCDKPEIEPSRPSEAPQVADLSMPRTERDSDENEPVFTEPWWDLRAGGPDEAEQRKVLQAELNVEVGPGHVLYHHTFAVIARSQAQDDVLFALDNERWALVHLTWRRAREMTPLPKTAVFDSLSDATDAVAAD